MFDAVAAWFVVGMFVAGLWLVVGSLLPDRRLREPVGDGRRGVRLPA